MAYQPLWAAQHMRICWLSEASHHQCSVQLHCTKEIIFWGTADRCVLPTGAVSPEPQGTSDMISPGQSHKRTRKKKKNRKRTQWRREQQFIRQRSNYWSWVCSLNSEENGGTEWEFPQRHRKCKKNQTELKNNRNENDTRGTQQFRLENVEWIGHLENTAVEIIQQEKETETKDRRPA